MCVDGSLPGPDRTKLGNRSRDSALYQRGKCATNEENAQTSAFTLTSVSRRVCEQIRDKAVLLPLGSILCLLHRDLVYM